MSLLQSATYKAYNNIALVTRTPKQEKKYEDYRKAWFQTTGFCIPTTIYTVINAFNHFDRNLNYFNPLQYVKDRLANPLDDFIESTIVPQFGVVAAVDDFSSSGKLEYLPAQVDGKLQISIN